MREAKWRRHTPRQQRTGASKGHQRQSFWIDATGKGRRLNGVGHVGGGDLKDTTGCGGDRQAQRVRHVPQHSFPCQSGIHRQRPRQRGFCSDASQNRGCVCHRRLSAALGIGRRTGICARALGPHL